MKWTTIWVDDWIVGTSPLDAAERGVFFTIVAYFISKDCRIPDDDHYLSRMCNMTIRGYRKAKTTLIDGGFIEIVDNSIWIEKAAKQWGKDEVFSKKQSEKARKRHDLTKAKLLEDNELHSAGAEPSNTRTHTQTHKYKNSKNDDLKNVEGPILLKSTTYEKARDAAPGYDIYYLEGVWKDWNKSKGFVPDNPDAAFLGFCRKHAKENPL